MNQQSKPRWLTLAEEYIGTKEIPGNKHNQDIIDFWESARLTFKTDETPWCAGFVGAMLEESGIRSTRSGMAKSYLKWGIKLEKPVLGCLVIFTRKGGGHVGFVQGTDKQGNLYVLGGNQSDSVCVKLFKKTNVVGYRWPEKEPLGNSLPVLDVATAFETKVV